MCVCGTHSRWSRSGWFCSSSWARGRPGLSAAAGGGAEGPWRSDVCWDASRIRSSSRGLRPEPPCNRGEKSWLNETLLCVHTFILRFARSLARSLSVHDRRLEILPGTNTHSFYLKLWLRRLHRITVWSELFRHSELYFYLKEFYTTI